MIIYIEVNNCRVCKLGNFEFSVNYVHGCIVYNHKLHAYMASSFSVAFIVSMAVANMIICISIVVPFDVIIIVYNVVL